MTEIVKTITRDCPERQMTLFVPRKVRKNTMGHRQLLGEDRMSDPETGEQGIGSMGAMQGGEGLPGGQRMFKVRRKAATLRSNAPIPYYDARTPGVYELV
eukprot:761627-Hanusia_phi.AAC.2